MYHVQCTWGGCRDGTSLHRPASNTPIRPTTGARAQGQAPIEARSDFLLRRLCSQPLQQTPAKPNRRQGKRPGRGLPVIKRHGAGANLPRSRFESAVLATCWNRLQIKIARNSQTAICEAALSRRPVLPSPPPRQSHGPADGRKARATGGCLSHATRAAVPARRDRQKVGASGNP
jgi:hypothetical protein